jgi:putative DNA primase/helicase
MTKDPFTLHDMQAALLYISPEDRDTWRNVGMGLKAEFGELAFDVWDTWSQSGSTYSAADARAVWKSMRKGGVTLGTVVHLAMQAGWKPERKELSAEERKRLNREAEERRAQRHAEIEADEARVFRLNVVVAEACQRIWKEFCKPVGQSAYLGRKQVGAHGVRFLRQKVLVCIDDNEERVDIWTGSGIKDFFDDLPKPRPDHLRIAVYPANALIIPMLDIEGFMWAFQVIDDKGEKLFPKYGRKSGCFHVLGSLEASDGQHIAYAEGYATAASVYEAMGNTMPVVVTLDSGNLGKVVAQFREKLPEVTHLVCGDDDKAKPDNPGRKAAQAAAAGEGAAAVFPVMPEGTDGTDWNDLHVACGLPAVREQIEAGCLRASLPRMTDDVVGPDADAYLCISDDSSPSHLDGAQFADGGEFFPEDDQPQSGGGKPFARYQLADLLQHMSLIYGTDALWDNLNRVQMRLSALRHVVGRDLFKDWERSPFRRVVKGLVFEPSGVVPADYINTFDCLPLTPAHAPGGEGCEKIRAHLWNLAGRREEEFFWLLKWIAYPLQNPGAKMDTSVIMYGSEGPGKSVLWEKIVGPIYGQYAITIGQSQLESQFTGWQAGKLLAICEEVVSRTERAQHKGQLKHLVTGRTLMINEKNLPLREETNHLNFVFLSNSTIPLELDLGDRRYMVLFCNMEQPAGYFDELFQEIGSGGIEAFYGYLMSLDLAGFGPHTKPPLNREKEGLMEVSLPSPVLFLREWQGGHLDLPYVSCPKSLLFEQYRRWCERTNEFKKRDRDFTAELRRYLKEDRRDLRIPSENSPHKTTRIWVTPDDAQLEGTDDYISRLEWSCRKFILECDKQSGQRYGQEAA